MGEIEILMINDRGIMISVQGQDYFLSSNRVPWMRDATERHNTGKERGTIMKNPAEVAGFFRVESEDYSPCSGSSAAGAAAGASSTTIADSSEAATC